MSGGARRRWVEGSAGQGFVVEGRLSGRTLVWTFVISLVLLAVVLFFLSRMMQKPRERRGAAADAGAVRGWLACQSTAALAERRGWVGDYPRAARCTSSSDTSVGQIPLTRAA